MMPLLRFTAALDHACRIADEILALPLDEVRETLLLAPASVAQDDISGLLALVEALDRTRKALSPASLPGAPYSVLEAELRRAALAQADGADSDPSRVVFGQGVC